MNQSPFSEAYASEVANALGANFLFQGLSGDQIAALAHQVTVTAIPEGQVIVREYEQADTLYMVIRGGVNVTKANGQFLSFLGPGGFFGEMALFLEDSRRSATCQASADTTCILIRKSVLEHFCATHPEAGLKIYQAIIRVLSQRLQATSADLAVLMSTNVFGQSQVSQLVKKTKNRSKQASAKKPKLK
jgi:CRP-like cAMP-binding protein